MPKRGMDSSRLHALAFNYLDLFFCQPVKLVEPGRLSAHGRFWIHGAGNRFIQGFKVQVKRREGSFDLSLDLSCVYATACLSIFSKESNIGINYTPLI
jgi:hypothetical protein